MASLLALLALWSALVLAAVATVVPPLLGSMEATEMMNWEFLGSNDRTMVLLLNGDVYTPQPIGKVHILLAGGTIVALFKDSEFAWTNLTGLPVNVVDVRGCIVIPGLIDIHVHVTGGGGEMGPSSRTPEGTVAEIAEAGISTVVGVLGTDCVSRSLENLRTKVKALQLEGLTTFMWSGCYRVPSPTLTGSVLRDLQLIEEVIGAGEIAISDHRGSWSSTEELLHLVSDARVGGMLSGKAGIVHFHVGSASSMLDPLWSVVNASRGEIPMTQMLPTHTSSRGPELLEAAELWVKSGGRVDFTSDQEGENSSFEALKDWAKREVPLGSVSLSSDAFGSLPVFDSKGQLVKYAVASPKANLRTIRQLILDAGWPVEAAISLSTTNPAKFLNLRRKGRLAQGNDGDVLVLDSRTYELKYLFAMGKPLVSPASYHETGTYVRHNLPQQQLFQPLQSFLSVSTCRSSPEVNL